MCRDCGCEEASHQRHHEKHHEKHHKKHKMRKLHKLLTRAATPNPVENHKIGQHNPPRKITVEQSILAKNEGIARENRAWFEKHGMRVLNLISSPGSGKTLLLEKTVEILKRESPAFKMVILTGDQERDFDAQRLQAAGADVLQLNTPSSCHLDASMIQKQLEAFVRPEHRLLIIENVGNLVCPAAFDLGESQKVALLSTPEGEDKPSKYPLLFHEAGLIVITKMDLVPYLDWKLELCEQHIRRVNASAPIFRLSAKTGVGLGSWLEFIQSGRGKPLT